MNLKYFQSVDIPEELQKTFEQLEALLQREHLTDGTHPFASESQPGFMTPEQAKKLDEVWTYLQKLQNKT